MKLFIAIATGTTTVALIEISSGIQKIWIEDGKRKEFCELFNCYPESNKKTAIVIPQFPLGNLTKECSEKLLEMIAKDFKSIKRLKETDKLVLALADVRTASNILSAFSEVKLPLSSMPVIEYDDQDLIKNDEYDSFILIGLYSNDFIMRNINDPDIHTNRRVSRLFILESKEELKEKFGKYEDYYPILSLLPDNGCNEEPKPFKVTFRITQQSLKSLEFEKVPEDVRKSLEKMINDLPIDLDGFLDSLKEVIDKKKLEKYKSSILNNSIEYDYVLISKVKLKDNKDRTAIVIGGITAKGTDKIGNYIRHKWKDLYDYVDSKSLERRKKKIEKSEFAAVLQVPPNGDYKEIKIIEVRF